MSSCTLCIPGAAAADKEAAIVDLINSNSILCDEVRKGHLKNTMWNQKKGASARRPRCCDTKCHRDCCCATKHVLNVCQRPVSSLSTSLACGCKTAGCVTRWAAAHFASAITCCIWSWLQVQSLVRHLAESEERLISLGAQGVSRDMWVNAFGLAQFGSRYREGDYADPTHRRNRHGSCRDGKGGALDALTPSESEVEDGADGATP